MPTFRCSMTSVSCVDVIKQTSADPGVGQLALGSNSLPCTCRLIFCCPKLSAFLPPCRMTPGYRSWAQTMLGTIDSTAGHRCSFEAQKTFKSKPVKV